MQPSHRFVSVHRPDLSSKQSIVVSPLIALMKDQVDGLRQNGVKAAYFNSSLSLQEQQEVTQLLLDKQLTLLYVAPERLMQESFLQLLHNVNINLIAIDEAHCISEWGHDFRPDYRELKRLRSLFPTIQILSLTATATPQVKNDITKQLNLQNAKQYQASFDRPNLTYFVLPKQQPSQQILNYIHAHSKDSGIIYCQSRKDVDKLAAYLQSNTIKALPYHAGLTSEQRQKHQEEFIHEDIDIIVATIAFGMGIDKSNVRYVIPADLPKSLEGYYQETGRAGRDGLPSECILLYSYADKRKSEFFIQQKDKIQQKVAYKQLDDMVHFAKYNKCRRIILLKYFDEDYKKNNCKACDNCISPKETFDATIIAQKILSCVYRVNERFGMKHVADILTGAKSQKVISFRHDTLSTYGIVKDFTPQQIQTLIQDLIEENYLQIAGDQYPIVKLTEKSTLILRKKKKVFLQVPVVKDLKKKKRPLLYADVNQELFETLRKLRKRLANEQNVPPYVIFADKSLQQMATTFPQ